MPQHWQLDRIYIKMCIYIKSYTNRVWSGAQASNSQFVFYHLSAHPFLFYTREKAQPVPGLFEKSIEQCFAAHIVQCCQRYCSRLLHLIAG